MPWNENIRSATGERCWEGDNFEIFTIGNQDIDFSRLEKLETTGSDIAIGSMQMLDLRTNDPIDDFRLIALFAVGGIRWFCRSRSSFNPEKYDRDADIMRTQIAHFLNVIQPSDRVVAR